MSFRKLLLTVGVCVGALYCRSYLESSETRPLSELTILNNTSELIQNNICPAGNASCRGSQSQNGQYLYMQTSTPNFSTIIIHNTTAGTVLSRTEESVKWEITARIRAAVVQVLSHITLVISSASILVLVVSFFWLYFTGSLFFDIAHYFLHKFSKSRYWILRCIGYLHEVHHLYFNRRLKFNDRYLWQNMLCELPLELSCQLFGTSLGYLAAQALSLTGPGLLSQELFHLVLVFEVIRSFVVAILEGRDSNHQSYSNVVPKDPHSFLVGPEYHALHHVDPSAYISSSFRVFDWFLGTSYTLRMRRIAMAGFSGAFSKVMKGELESKESVNCIHELPIHEDEEKMVEALSNTDIMIVSPGDDSCESALKMIELFKQHYKARPGHSLFLPEVWYIDSLNETPSSERAFAPHVRKYYDAEDIIYQHIIVSKPTSYFGKTFLGPDFAAKVALWWVRRGARYIHVANLGSALWGYFKFFYSVRGQEVQ